MYVNLACIFKNILQISFSNYEINDDGQYTLASDNGRRCAANDP